MAKWLGGKSPPAEEILFEWPDGTPFRVSDMHRHVACMGATGSGKSSGPGLWFARALLRIKSGGLILASKPEDREFWQARFAEAKREDDLWVFSESSDRRFNFLDNIGGDSRTITRCLLTIAENLGGDQSGREEKFWASEQRRCLYNAIEIVRQGDVITGPNIQQFIADAPTSREQIEGPDWAENYHRRISYRANWNVKREVEGYDCALGLRYWAREWMNTADKQRSGVVGMVNTVLQAFNTGIVRLLCSTSTNCSPADMERGKWILVDVDPHDDTGKFILTGWKFLTERHILKRKAKPDDATICIVSDEFPNVINSADAQFLAEARSHRGCMLVLAQSIHSFMSAMGGERGQSYVETILGNTGTKIFTQLADSGSAEFASKLLGSRRETFINVDQSDPVSQFDVLSGNVRYKSSYNQKYEPILQSALFMDGRLRTGGPPDYQVDAWVVASRPFKSGERFAKVTFPQR